MITLAALIMFIKITKNYSRRREEQWMLFLQQKQLLCNTLKELFMKWDTAGEKCYKFSLDIDDFVKSLLLKCKLFMLHFYKIMLWSRSITIQYKVSHLYHHQRECGSTLYVGLARTAPPTNTNFRLTFLLTRLQEALYEDLPV